MDTKKPTNAQLNGMIKNAVVFVPKDKETKSVYFSDKGLRLTVTDDYCVIATNFHRHVFDKITSNGYSRPYLYVSQFVDMALHPANDCKVNLKDGGYTFSMSKLFSVLKAKEDQTDYTIATYVDWWLFNIFSPLFGIDENRAAQFITLFDYMSNIAKNKIILDEHKKGLTNKEFAKQHAKLMKDFLKDIQEGQILVAESDEDKLKKEAEALKEQEQEESIKEEQ